MTRRLGLLFVVPVAAFLFAQLSHSQRAHLPAALQDALTEQALTFLRNEYDILVTGNRPAETLVPRLIGMARVEMSGEERIAALLKGRESSLQNGKRYTSIDITLNPERIEERDGRVRLYAVDNRVEHFTFHPPPSRPIPDIYEESTHHDFIFSVTRVSANTPRKPYTIQVGEFEYTLIKDITEPQLLNVSDEEDDEGKSILGPPANPLKDKPPIDEQTK